MVFDHINISGPMAALEQTQSFYCQLFGLNPGHGRLSPEMDAGCISNNRL